jgi:hypothetical protein
MRGFPISKEIPPCRSGTAAALLDIAGHCTGLRVFHMESDDRSGLDVDISTLAREEPSERRVAAIQASSALTSLLCLQLAVSDEAEVAAVAATGAALLSWKSAVSDHRALHSICRCRFVKQSDAACEAFWPGRVAAACCALLHRGRYGTAPMRLLCF